MLLLLLIMVKMMIHSQGIFACLAVELWARARSNLWVQVVHVLGHVQLTTCERNDRKYGKCRSTSGRCHFLICASISRTVTQRRDLCHITRWKPTSWHWRCADMLKVPTWNDDITVNDISATQSKHCFGVFFCHHFCQWDMSLTYKSIWLWKPNRV